MLGDQVVAGAEVIQLADQRLQRALDLTAIRLRCGLIIAGIIWKRAEVRYAAAGCGEDHTSQSTQYFGDTKEMDNVII